jgi:hypothetical protein
LNRVQVPPACGNTDHISSLFKTPIKPWLRVRP